MPGINPASMIININISVLFVKTKCMILVTLYISECPSILIPHEAKRICQAVAPCLGVTCCQELDLIITKIRTPLKYFVDPCNMVLFVGLGSWELNVTLASYTWGEEKVIMIGDAIEIR